MNKIYISVATALFFFAGFYSIGALMEKFETPHPNRQVIVIQPPK